MEYEDWLDGELCLTDSHAECPHCHHIWREDDWYPGDYDTTETHCPKCEKPLKLTAMIHVRIYASKAKGEGDEN